MKTIKSIAAVSLLAATLISTAPMASIASDGAGNTVTASSQTPNMFQNDTATDPGTSGSPGGSMDTAPGSDMTTPDASPGSPITTPDTPAATTTDRTGGASADMDQDTTTKRRLRSYAVLKGGLYAPSQTVDLSNLDPNISNGRAHFKTDVGFAGEVAFGHYLLPVLAVELGAGYFQRNGDFTMIRVVPITLSAKICLPLGPFEPYGMAGIGAYIADQDIKGSAIKGKTDVTYGMNLGAGFDINVNRSMFVGLEGKYLWSEPTFRGQNVRLDGFITTVNVGFRY
jgi:opacity protein-like surface antigen